MNAVNSGVSVISGDKTERGELMQSHRYQKDSILNKEHGEIEKIFDRQPYLGRWVIQLNQALTSGTQQDCWEMLGHGLVIEDGDSDLCEKYLKTICQNLNVEFMVLPSVNVSKINENLANISTPLIIFIEPDDWYLNESEGEQSLESQQAIRNFMTSLMGKPVVLILMADEYIDIAKKFRHQGMFDRHVEWLKPKPEFIIDDLMALVGPGVIESSVMEPPNRLGCLLSVYYAPYRRLGILAIALKRRAYHRSKKIDWADIYHIVASGTGEGFNLPNKIQQENVANHEAGHALIMMLESNCQNVPDIASIQPGKGYVGIVLESTENYHKEDGATSFSQACSRIRVNLAGRAAEELIGGSACVDVFFGRDDLKHASNKAMDLVSRGGFHSSYGSPNNSGLNLLTLKDSSNEDNPYYQTQARELLDKQYQYVMNTLSENKALLIQIKNSLLENQFLTQQDFKDLGLIPAQKWVHSGSLDAVLAA